jgi:DNA-binding MarR family transcriptional regulator
MTDELTNSIIDFAWACWAELGVAASRRRPFEMAIDLEPLILLTRSVGHADSRLRSNAEQWSAEHRDLISRARLKRLGPSPSVPTDTRPAGRSSLTDRVPATVDSPATLQLRVRSALGVSARAEIVRQLLVEPTGTSRPASDLAQLTAYSKRNIEKALASLERSGWLQRSTGTATTSWRLHRNEELVSLFAPVPRSPGSFLALAELLQRAMELTRHEAIDPDVRSVMARRLLADTSSTSGWGAIRTPSVDPGSDAYEGFVSWVRQLPESAVRR